MNKIHRVVTISEEESECEAPPGLKLVREGFVPSVSEQEQLDKVLEEYGEVLCAKPGRTGATKLCIRTGDHEPVRSHPYRNHPDGKRRLGVRLTSCWRWASLGPPPAPGLPPL